MKKLTLLFVLLNSVLLGACTTVPSNDQDLNEAALAVDRRTRDTVILDKDIQSEAYSELRSNQDIKQSSHVTINVYNGIVLVTGETPSVELRKEIISTVQNIANVKLIHNNLTVGQPTDANSRANDALITDTVKIALKQIRTLPNFDPAMVKVVTENSVVYLMGAVHRNEGTVVVNVTRLQPGIKQIITVFQYLD
ncbi:MAG: BON domain-containing protein [Methylococcales bacterium]|nr:BON domain-containing protein [Methylococcales bacterium]